MNAARLIILALVALPVFTGWMPVADQYEIVPGLAWGPVLSAAAALAGVAVTCGRSFLANTLAVTALILVPIVYVGGTVSWLAAIIGGAAPGRHGAHYAALALNMLGVIPLALALVAAIPFHRLEQGLLGRTRGIPAREKFLLMFVRVFHHIVDFVIPSLLEIMREENLPGAALPGSGGAGDPAGLKGRPRRLIAGLVQVGVGGICAALRFIPLWAREIDDLPSNHHGSPS